MITGSRCKWDSTSCCHGDKSFCFHLIVLLPPANKIWSKVIFSHLCVILFIGGSASRGSASRGVCLQERGLHPWGVYLGGSASMGVGQTVPHLDTMRYGQRVGGMDPTGMYSCWTLMFAELSNEVLRNCFWFVLFCFNLICHFTCLDLWPFKLFSFDLMAFI